MSSDANVRLVRCQVKLAAIHYYVWHGPHDPAREQFSLSYLKGLRLGEQLMPTPLVTAQVRAAVVTYARKAHRASSSGSLTIS